MATNLTPAQLEWLRQQQYQAPSGSGWSPETAYGPMGTNVDQTAENGDTFHTTYSGQGSIQDGGISYAPTGLLRDVVAGKNKPGDMQEVYDTSGRYQTTAAIPQESFMDAWGPFLMALGPMAASVFPGLGASMSFGSNEVLGAAGGGMGGGLGPVGAGAFDGAGFEGLTAADLGGGGLGTFPSAELMEVPGALDYGPAFTAGGGAAGAGGGLLGKALGLGSTVLGALSGAKPGGGPGGDVEKKMDPRMDALTYDDLFKRAQGLLAEQMTPERSQGWRDMQSVGKGLLNQPVAGNGFERFVKGRR